MIKLILVLVIIVVVVIESIRFAYESGYGAGYVEGMRTYEEMHKKDGE